MTGLAEFAREFEELRSRVEQLEALVQSGRLVGDGFETIIRNGRVVGDQPARIRYKPSEVATMLGCSTAKVRAMISAGEIEAEDMGHFYGIPRSEVDRLAGRAS